MITRAAIATALLVTGLGMGAGPAGAAPVAPRTEISAGEVVQITHRYDRRRQSYYPRYRYRPRHNYYRPKQVCFTKIVIRYTHWGPQWVPVRSCYWR